MISRKVCRGSVYKIINPVAIYVSNSGNTTKVAEYIAEELKCSTINNYRVRLHKFTNYRSI